ncbi:MAG: hypothetical protein GY769_01415 [bacterium]|nr:hypothetical protein [bacterium]
MAKVLSRGLPVAVALASALTVLPVSAGAWELRNETNLTIPKGEMLEDSLIATGEVVRIDGDINGDLIAVGRQVEVSGTVTGTVFIAAQSVDANGNVGGTLAGFGQWVRVGGAVSGNLYSFGQNIRLLEESSVGRDAMMFGELLDAGGTVGRDLTAGGRKLTVGGRIGRNLEMQGEELELTPSSEIVGSIDTELPADDNLTVAEGATVGGSTEIRHATPDVRKSRYSKPGFYVWGLIKLAGAFLLGALLFWALPGLFGHELASVGAGLLRAGAGLLALIATPVALVLAAITLVGLPVALVGGALFLMALYLAKILVADWLGRSVLSSNGSRPRVFVALLTGLAILAVAGAIPWIGGLIKFAVLLLGLGMLTHRAWEAVGHDAPVAAST